MACYDVSDWERQQWRYQRMVNPAAAEAERDGAARYAGFDRFTAEQFHALYADEPRKVDGEDPADAVFRRLHAERDAIPEMAELRNRTRGDDVAAAIANATVTYDLLKGIARPDQPTEDPAADAEMAAQLEALKASLQLDDEATEELQQMIDAAAESAAAKGLHVQAAADAMDGTDIREAYRKAAVAAQKAIDDHQAAVDGLMAGTDPHSGSVDRRLLSRQMAGIVKNNSRLAEIAKMAGRLRRIAQQKQREKVQHGMSEVIGVEQGDDLARTLPSEFAFLADDDMDVIFYQRYSNRCLAQWKKRGKSPENRGPIVFCLDSSGSMGIDEIERHGRKVKVTAPIVWAAACALAYLDIARAQGRSFAIVHFGDRVLRTDRFDGKAPLDRAAVMDAVGFFGCDGGTNFNAPLADALRIIETDAAFGKADIVFCTDGMADISAATQRAIEQRRASNGLAIYTILIDVMSAGYNCDPLRAISTEVVELSQEDSLRDDVATAFFGKV